MGTPTVTPITELRHAWGFLVGDINDGMFSRKQIILASGAGVCTAGLVLGKISVGAVTEAALGANTGNPTFSSIAVAAPATPGEYDMTMIDATHFTVEAAGGAEIGHGQLGVAFSGGGIGFTATAGGTACVAGDSFKIVVAEGSDKFKAYDPTANDGSEVACAILGSSYKDATSADKKAGALVGGPSKVNASELIWGPNVTNQQAAALAHLATLGIQSV